MRAAGAARLLRGLAALALSLAAAATALGQVGAIFDDISRAPLPGPAAPALRTVTLEDLSRDRAGLDLADAGAYARDALALPSLVRSLGATPSAEQVAAAIAALPRVPGPNGQAAPYPLMIKSDLADTGVFVRTDRALSLIDAAGDRGLVLGSEYLIAYDTPLARVWRMEELSARSDAPDWALPFVAQSTSHGRVIRRSLGPARGIAGATDFAYLALDPGWLSPIKPQAALYRRFVIPWNDAMPEAGAIIVDALRAPTAANQDALRRFVASQTGSAAQDVDLAHLAIVRNFWVSCVLALPDGHTLWVARGYTQSHQTYGPFWRQVFDPQALFNEEHRSLDFASALVAKEP